MLALLTFAGCDSGVSAQLALTGLSSTCRINSDCDDLLVCAFQRCHQACVTSRDCQGEARCVGGEQPRHVCQLESERSCSPSGACPGAEVCGRDRQCRDGCSSNRDCVNEQLCTGGTCADQSELEDGGTLPTPSGSPALAVRCTYNSDCSGKLVCVAGSCRLECIADGDCAIGMTCQESRCRVSAAGTPGCSYNSDCANDQRCVAGGCAPLPVAPECHFDSDCGKTGQRCVDGACGCQCESDSDCGGTEICQGACACVAGRIIAGDVTVRSSQELKLLDGVAQIQGVLLFAIQTPVAASYHLRTLRKVGSIGTSPNVAVAPARYIFDSLEEVDSLGCADCVTPVLRKAGKISFVHGDGGPVPLVDLPALESVDELTMQGGNDVREVRAPKLTRLLRLALDENPKLTAFSAPALTSTESIHVTYNGLLTKLDLSTLATVGELTVQSNYSLGELSLPLLTDAARVSIGYNAFGSLKLPRLARVDSFDLGTSGGSLSLDIGALEKVTGLFHLETGSRLTTLSFKYLTGVHSN